MTIEQQLAQAIADLAERDQAITGHAAAIAAETARAETAVADLATVTTQLATSTEDAAAADTLVADAAAAQLAAETALAAMTTERDNLAAVQRDVDTEVAAKVAAIAAGAGGNPLGQTPKGEDTPTLSAKDAVAEQNRLWAECAKIVDPAAKRAFYAKHLQAQG